MSDVASALQTTAESRLTPAQPEAVSQPAENPAPEKSSTRPYVVFFEVEEDTYKKIGVQEASSPEQAVALLVGMEAAGKAFGATPERNWKLVKPSVRPASLSF